MSDLDFLREATDVSADAVRQLRLRVSDAVARRKRRRRLWVACAATAAVLLAIVPLAPRRELETIAVQPAPPPVQPSLVAPLKAARWLKPASRKPLALPAVIHLETSDPDVVIYLVSSTGGEE